MSATSTRPYGALPLGAGQSPARGHRGSTGRASAKLMSLSLAHWHTNTALFGDLDRAVVAGIHVPDDAHAGVVREHALELLGGERRAVGERHLARMNRAANADTTAVVDRHPRRPRRRIYECVEQRP